MFKHLDEFLLHLQTNNYSPETVLNYERDLRTLAAYLSAGGIKFDQLKRRHLEEYKAYLRSIDRETLGELVVKAKRSTSRPRGSRRSEKLSTRSINRMLSSFRSYLKHLTENSVPTPLSRDEVELIRGERKKSRVAELEDLVKLIEFPSRFEKNQDVALRNRAFLEVLFATGMRISELVNLNRDQLDTTGRIFIIGKGRKERFVYLTPRAAHHLRAYLDRRQDDSPALFVPLGGRYQKEHKKRLGRSYIQKKIKQYVRLLGITVPTTAHSLRHGYGTYLAEEGASPVAIQILLGHESPATTARYIHASDRFAEEQHRRHHPLYKP